jgi:predicted secreted protein
MKKKSIFAALLFAAFILPALAGDIANFVSLGFSADSKYFMFGQHGLLMPQGTPWAEIRAVDTAKNEFLPGTTFLKTYSYKAETGQDSSGAFYSLFAQAAPLAFRYGIDHLKTGRLLYLLVNGHAPERTLSFKDYSTGYDYELTLEQSLTLTEGRPSSSFGLELKVTRNGATAAFPIGSPSVLRRDVESYLVRSILAAPDGRTLVLVIEKKTLLQECDPGVRFMVETIRIPD